MDYSVYEIGAGINLNCFPSDNEGMSFLSVNILSQLSRETVSLNAVIPFVLSRGCFSRPDSVSLNAAMEAAGGMSAVPFSEKYGEVQAVGFSAEFPDAYIKPAASLLCEMLSNPATRGGLLLPNNVKDACEALAEEAADHEEGLLERCTDEMCAFEDYSVSPFGSADEILNINYKKLSRHYKTLLQTAPIEMVYIGSADEKQLVNLLRRELNTLARTEIDYEMGTDVRLNSVEEEPRRICGSSFDGIERIALGYRFGDGFFDNDCTVYELMLKLAEAGLEKNYPGAFNSVCIYKDFVKGIFALSAAPEESGSQAFEEAFKAVLSGLARGEFTSQELAEAADKVRDTLAETAAKPSVLCRYVLSSILSGREPDIDEAYACLGSASSSDIASAAAGAVCDLIYEDNTDN